MKFEPDHFRSSWMARYRELADLMYTVRSTLRSRSVLAVSTLNPRHPISEDHRRMVRELQTQGHLTSPSLLRLAVQAVLFGCLVLLEAGALFYLRLHFRKELVRDQDAPADLVMKGYAFRPVEPDDGNDFYYGTLFDDLEERGVRCVRLIGDARGGIDVEFTRAAFACRRIRTLPELVWVSPRVVIEEGVRLLGTAVQLIAMGRARERLMSDFCRVAAAGSLRRHPLRSALAYHVARAVVKKLRPKVFLTLFEGQPWEIVMRHGVKDEHPPCRTAGYQHTVVMPHALSLIRPNTGSWERSVPEWVLCTGERTRDMMLEGHAPHLNRFVVLGSYRHDGSHSVADGPAPARRTVLVLPEGVLEEACLLFGFAMRAARLVPDHTFIFRCHPRVPYERVSRAMRQRPDRQSNIRVSDRASIADDFARASSVLYRGTSSAFYAVLKGLKLFYLHDASHPDVDPLFELSAWRETVSAPEELKVRLNALASDPREMLERPWNEACDYVRGYTRPVSAETLERFLFEAGLNQGEPLRAGTSPI
ncbi:MAG: hypothetical protein HYY14_00505 [Candidatus Omnitrophica bacterium]|nr:hypothetical protein [Candidatus Omnitrophota bacterium]